jgi:hypothetical protein
MALPTIAPEPVEVMTGCRDQEGRLVFADEQLVPVLVRLEDAVHEYERRGWFLEVGAGTRLSRTLCIQFGRLTPAQDA